MKNKITLVKTHLRFGKGEINGLIFLMRIVILLMMISKVSPPPQFFDRNTCTNIK